ncbi:hypothetical protein B0H12DRAFT_1091242 [Mycena haematopus]|nr:hypothetical protein B0H12DRAFT_1091242 [Mycena haematopus]
MHDFGKLRAPQLAPTLWLLRSSESFIDRSFATNFSFGQDKRPAIFRSQLVHRRRPPDPERNTVTWEVGVCVGAQGTGYTATTR